MIVGSTGLKFLCIHVLESYSDSGRCFFTSFQSLSECVVLPKHFKNRLQDKVFLKESGLVGVSSAVSSLYVNKQVIGPRSKTRAMISSDKQQRTT